MIAPVHTGRCWRFGDNINTDLMWPSAAFRATPEERLKLVFSAIRPGWSDAVRDGDVLIAGTNFGTGSGRPAASLLRELGIAAVVAPSINGLFMRNAINTGLATIECAVPDDVAEGDTVTVDVLRGTVTTDAGVRFSGSGLPEELWEIVAAGGILPRLRREGYVAAP
jgi:3-isopropylmalate/(R)-2-methylmalate dehydratase small subunit